MGPKCEVKVTGGGAGVGGSDSGGGGGRGDLPNFEAHLGRQPGHLWTSGKLRWAPGIYSRI